VGLAALELRAAGVYHENDGKNGHGITTTSVEHSA
jgi:hypothetical protein